MIFLVRGSRTGSSPETISTARQALCSAHHIGQELAWLGQELTYAREGIAIKVALMMCSKHSVKGCPHSSIGRLPVAWTNPHIRQEYGALRFRQPRAYRGSATA